MQPTRSLHWRTPEAIVEVGFRRSRVVMMNEAHDGDLRCIRTRLIGQRVLVPAHHAGVRYLAMEALRKAISEEANRTRRLTPCHLMRNSWCGADGDITTSSGSKMPLDKCYK